VILVEFVVMFALVYIGFHVIIIGFKSFFRVLVLVAAAPLAIAPGPTRRFGRRSAHTLIIDGVEMLATTAGLGVVTIILAEVTSGSVPGLTGMSSPVAKLMMMLLLAVAGAFAYHHMLVSFRGRREHHLGGPFERLAMAGRNLGYIDYLSVSATDYSLSGWRRRGKYHDPKAGDLWPGRDSNLDPDDDQPKGPQPVYIVDTPGRAAHPTPDRSGGTAGNGSRSPGSSGASGRAGRAVGAAAAVAAPELEVAELGGAAAGRFAQGAVGRPGRGPSAQHGPQPTGAGASPSLPQPASPPGSLGPGQPGWVRPGNPGPLPGR